MGITSRLRYKDAAAKKPTNSLKRTEELALSNTAYPIARSVALAWLLVLASPASQAFGFGDMFNPGRWMGGNDDDDYYNEGPWPAYGPGPYAAPGGYGPYGGYGYGPYAAPGYGAPPGAYATTPGYRAPAASAPSEPAPSPSQSAKDQEIETLKRRIEQLESRNAATHRPQPSPPQSEGWPSAPSFRPMDQY
jgi:hypothetical protein